MLGRILLAGGALSLTSVYLYAKYLHQSLASQIKSCEISAKERKARYEAGEIKCLPSDLVDNPQGYRIIHVQDERPGSVSLPNDEQKATELFTKLLRRNMRIFSQTPQAWMLRMMTKTDEQKQSYNRKHIESVNFKEGDLVCGFNRILQRDPLKVEVDLELPEGMGSSNFGGRLVISLISRGKEAVLRTQTLQWIPANETMVLPLERGPANFLHETASWYMLVSGMDYLKNLTETQ